MNIDSFPLSTALIRDTLATAMARGGDYADIYGEVATFNSLLMEEGILKTAVSDMEKGVGIRVVKGDRTGYAYSELFDRSNLLKAAKTAATIADDRGSYKSYDVTERRFANYYEVKDPSVDQDLAQKIQWITFAEQYARSLSDKISKVTVTLSDNYRQLLIANSDGDLAIDRQPMLRMAISVVCEHKGVRETAKCGDGGRLGFGFLTEARIKAWAQKAVDEALILLQARQAPAGMLPVILGAGDSGILLHEAIGHPLEADFNRKGTSAYSDRMNEMVADPQCTIVDDGTISHDRGSINMDDELVQSQRTVLIEGGRLVSYMHDRISAQHYGVEESGNGRRESYRYAPLPRMRSTYMLPGKYDPDEIIASTKRGIYCKTFDNGQVDISNGNFVFIPSEAYLIEDGRLSHPIKNFSLIGNGPEVLSNVSMVGDDFQMSHGIWTCGKGQNVPVGLGLPTIKIAEMTVGGQQG